MNKFFLFPFLVGTFLLLSSPLFSQKNENCIVKGIIVEKVSGQPVEFANVLLCMTNDSTFNSGVITNKKGEFYFDNLKKGTYYIKYSFLGYKNGLTPLFTIYSGDVKINLGKLFLSEVNQMIKEVQVIGQKSTFTSSIDRKTFNVGSDIMSKTGSVSDLLQNVPSVQVDIDGNVSLRGSDNVMILINGKPSALMKTNRAAVLQQMPANSIEKIEVITNPSAKYKPDGTSGIINIVTKKSSSLGFNTSLLANYGNNNRYNGNLVINYNPGKMNLFGSYGFRQDDRQRNNRDYRVRIDESKDSTDFYQIVTNENSRPLSHILNTGIDYKLNENNKFGVSGSYNYRSFVRTEVTSNLILDGNKSLIKNYDRNRNDPEFENDIEFNAYFQHTFAKEGHELNADFTSSGTKEQENNNYSNVYSFPQVNTSYDHTLIKQGDNETQFSLDYTNPVSDDITFEAGYIWEFQKGDMDFLGESLNPLSNQWELDKTKTNRFILSQNIHVLYSTWEQEFGKIGFLAGLRAEEALVNANQKTIGSIVKNNYFRLYPSLHLSYKFNESHELQTNYSHRIRRPEGDELNPYPEYQDPFNLRIGNPKLLPADIHSIEAGYQYKKDKTTLLSTFYYRYTYNGITSITRFINDSVQVTSSENLSKNSSSGLEFLVNTGIWKFENINFGTNAFYQTIDASGLGYAKKKSTISWSANLNAGLNLSRNSLLQVTANYSAEKLTPQGRQLPYFVMNAGFKQEILKNKGAITITVSDLFNSLNNKYIIDTPELYEEVIRKRSSRMIYLGFSYSFGHSVEKKENNLKYDNQL